MSTAVLSIGSNLGDRRAHLQSAVDGLSPYLVAVSPVYETPPWGPVEQDAFYNAVLTVRDPLASPIDWLRRAQEWEQRAGRIRAVHWGARTLDVDIVTVDSVRSDDPELTLPHPYAAERAFVLVPWLAIQPDAELPGVGLVRDLVAALPPDQVAAVRPVGIELGQP